MVDRVVGVLTRCALFHSGCDLKAELNYVQRSLIRKFMLYEIEPDHITEEATKTIPCAKDEEPVNHCTVNRGLEKFCVICKNLDD